MKKLLVLECILTDDLVQISVFDGARVDENTIFECTFTEPDVRMKEEEDKPRMPGGEESMGEQLRVALGPIFEPPRQRMEQLSTILHIALHNLTDCAKAALLEGHHG